LSKVRFNSTNEAEAWGKYRRWVLDGNVDEQAKNLANAELANVERSYVQKEKQFDILDHLIEHGGGTDNSEMMSLLGEVAVDAQFYHEALMYAKGERE
jgi:hypothetical protein